MGSLLNNLVGYLGGDRLAGGDYCCTIVLMNAPKRVKFQIDTLASVRDRAKAVAYARGKQLNEFVLEALAKEGDKELADLIQKDLAQKSKPGRPQK